MRYHLIHWHSSTTQLTLEDATEAESPHAAMMSRFPDGTFHSITGGVRPRCLFGAVRYTRPMWGPLFIVEEKASPFRIDKAAPPVALGIGREEGEH